MIDFTNPFSLPPGHYFFVPQVELSGADDNFFWLSANRPIVPPGTPFPRRHGFAGLDSQRQSRSGLVAGWNRHCRRQSRADLQRGIFAYGNRAGFRFTVAAGTAFRDGLVKAGSVGSLRRPAASSNCRSRFAQERLVVPLLLRSRDTAYSLWHALPRKIDKFRSTPRNRQPAQLRSFNPCSPDSLAQCTQQ